MTEKSPFIAEMEWAGEKILVARDGQFHVPFTESHYESIAKARDAIDRKQKQLEKVARRKLNLAVVDQDGVPRTITGCHSGNGKKLVTPKCDSYSPTFYPAHETIIALINRELDLRKQIDAIESTLSPFKLSRDPYSLYGELSARYDSVEDDYKAKMKAAEDLVMPEGGAQ